MKIQDTLPRTKSATWSVELPRASEAGMPSPTGTGFFISPDGWFVTAAHVVSDSNGAIRSDVNDGWLRKEGADPMSFMQVLNNMRLEVVIKECDFALLHVDFGANKDKDALHGHCGFQYISVSARPLDEGEAVYSFGYPLGESELIVNTPEVSIGSSALSPRTTSGIIASRAERVGRVRGDADPQLYVLDKALNYGNSGGPIVSVETGHAHALCARFQPVFIPQGRSSTGETIGVWIPSLYGIAMSLSDPRVQESLRQRSVRVEDT